MCRRKEQHVIFHGCILFILPCAFASGWVLYLLPRFLSVMVRVVCRWCFGGKFVCWGVWERGFNSDLSTQESGSFLYSDITNSILLSYLIFNQLSGDTSYRLLDHHEGHMQLRADVPQVPRCGFISAAALGNSAANNDDCQWHDVDKTKVRAGGLRRRRWRRRTIVARALLLGAQVVVMLRNVPAIPKDPAWRRGG
jgi:hypothetical protein